MAAESRNSPLVPKRGSRVPARTMQIRGPTPNPAATNRPWAELRRLGGARSASRATPPIHQAPKPRPCRACAPICTAGMGTSAVTRKRGTDDARPSHIRRCAPTLRSTAGEKAMSAISATTPRPTPAAVTCSDRPSRSTWIEKKKS